MPGSAPASIARGASGPDQPQLRAVVEGHGLAVDDASDRARRADLQAGARHDALARLGHQTAKRDGTGRNRDEDRK
jgi:hypothetical protein